MFGSRDLVIATVATVCGLGCEAYASGSSPPAQSPPPPEPAYVHPSAEDAQAGGYEDNDPSALDDFHGALDPHGTWVDDAAYGTVWVPAAEEVGPGFVPYVTAGHWVYEDDYIWASEYSWGWVPFHYGRWVHLDERRWGWIPGRVYAGAWVSWRIGAGGFDYVGWAPTPPTWIWRGRAAVRLGDAPLSPYVFCHRQELFAPVVSSRVVRGGAAVYGVEGRTVPYAPPAHEGGGRVAARPAQGPSPSMLGIVPWRVTRPAPTDYGLHAARQYAAPATAHQAGGRPPTPDVAPPRSPQAHEVPPPMGVTAPQPRSPARSEPTAIPLRAPPGPSVARPAPLTPRQSPRPVSPPRPATTPERQSPRTLQLPAQLSPSPGAPPPPPEVSPLPSASPQQRHPAPKVQH